VIFVASVFIPFVKFLILIYLLLSIQFRWLKRPKDRTFLYRATEAVGRWSMVDIYVVTILVALLKLGILIDVEAGPAAIYFASVVVMTMIAAESFDPRLIWDAMEEPHE
jgi:paraquat-inducible protein A